MIRRIQALNYRCLRHLDVSLGRFHLLAGPHGTGKSTLFDLLVFLGDLVREGPNAAVRKRTDDFRDLVWARPDEDPGFELAIEFEIPESCRDLLPEDRDFQIYRYEVAVRGSGEGVRIHHERGILLPAPKPAPAQANLFPEMPAPPRTVLAGGRPGWSTVLSKTPAGNDRFQRETDEDRGWDVRISLGPHRSALGSLPDSPDTMPVATALKDFLTGGVRLLRLEGGALGRASPPHLARMGLTADGGNLPWVVKRLRDEHAAGFQAWLAWTGAVLPGLADVDVAEREVDRHAYLVLRYAGGLKVPSGLESEGVLRLLALGLLPHLPEKGRIHLVDEPESGVHPAALSALGESLASVDRSQLLAATCSPALVERAEPEELICFARNAEGVIGVIKGSEHPLLSRREGPVDAGVVIAGESAADVPPAVD
ncbi:MAG: AAA family ATPase [Gemmatimonadota bacterium]|nr:AAA family ATPase [Gemmatimonadota bacterium]MDE2983877.1 AAA family ATPase [Gemmatimonadota bacterium]